MYFHLNDKSISDVLEGIADAYRTLFPKEYEEFLHIVRTNRHSLISPSGVSADGTLQSRCQIPALLYSFTRWQMHKRCGIDDFFRDSRHYDLLIKVWSDLRTGKSRSK